MESISKKDKANNGQFAEFRRHSEENESDKYLRPMTEVEKTEFRRYMDHTFQSGFLISQLSDHSDLEQDNAEMRQEKKRGKEGKTSLSS